MSAPLPPLVWRQGQGQGRWSGYGGGVDFVLHHAPWLAGSLGCCLLDFLVILQALYYDHWRRRRAGSDSNEADALLPPILA